MQNTFNNSVLSVNITNGNIPFLPVNHGNRGERRSVLDNTGLRLWSLNTTFGDIEWNVCHWRQRSRTESNSKPIHDFCSVTLNTTKKQCYYRNTRETLNHHPQTLWSHFWTCHPFNHRMKILWYLKHFRSYHVERQTHKWTQMSQKGMEGKTVQEIL